MKFHSCSSERQFALTERKMEPTHVGCYLKLSRAPRRRRFLEAQEVKDGQNARRVENGQADVPRELIVSCAFPHGNQLPDAIPDGQRDDDGDKCDEYRTFHIFCWLTVGVVGVT